MMPAIPVQSPVDDRRFHVKQVLRSGSAPSHLFLLAHAPVDQLIDGALHMGRRNTLSVPVRFSMTFPVITISIIFWTNISPPPAYLWPHVPLDRLWSRKSAKGFGTVPLTLPLIMQITDRLNVGKPVSSVYGLAQHALLELWKRRHDHTMTFGSYRKSGSVKDAIAKTCLDLKSSWPDTLSFIRASVCA
jgi:hypothetical protein